MKTALNVISPTPLVEREARDNNLRRVAVQLETGFLAEMLKSTGLGSSRDGMNGGVGEDQFNSFLVRAQAEQISRNGGIGLAEMLFRSLKETQNGR